MMASASSIANKHQRRLSSRWKAYFNSTLCGDENDVDRWCIKLFFICLLNDLFALCCCNCCLHVPFGRLFSNSKAPKTYFSFDQWNYPFRFFPNISFLPFHATPFISPFFCSFLTSVERFIGLATCSLRQMDEQSCLLLEIASQCLILQSTTFFSSLHQVGFLFATIVASRARLSFISHFSNQQQSPNSAFREPYRHFSYWTFTQRCTIACNR